MQTVYYTTRNFIRSTGNVVDLAEYRRKLAQAEGSLAPAPRHLVENAPAESPKKARSLPRLSLDSLASIGVLLMTLTFTLRILVF